MIPVSSAGGQQVTTTQATQQPTLIITNGAGTNPDGTVNGPTGVATVGGVGGTVLYQPVASMDGSGGANSISMLPASLIQQILQQTGQTTATQAGQPLTLQTSPSGRCANVVA